jgi:hypothetical protein
MKLQPGWLEWSAAFAVDCKETHMHYRVRR